MPKLQTVPQKVRDVIAEFRSGKLMVPEFQRDFVWRRNKAPPLLDSLYRDFPISSLLVWQSDGENTKARNSPKKRTSSGHANWLIDGQQRVTTLSRIWSGDQGIEVLFHPDEEQFRLPNAATKNDPLHIKVSQIWDDEDYRRLRRKLEAEGNWDKREARLEKVRRILDFEIPVVRMCEHSFESAVEAFRRINTMGVKLRKADIESAQVAAKHTGFIVDNVLPFISEIHRDRFDRITVMHLFRACAFVAQPDGRNRTPLHNLDRNEVLKAWKTTELATRTAINLIRSEFGLVSMDILWSGALLVPIICLCAANRTRDIDRRAIAGWVALATLHHRFSGSSETALDSDLRACRSDDPIGALLNNLRKDYTALKATESDFNGSLADRSGLFAAYIACKQKGVQDFTQGGTVAFQPQIDRHHILPRGQFPSANRSNADRIANIAFLSGAVNKSINMAGPEVYLPQLPTGVLTSQCIPIESKLWRVQKADEFFYQRRKLLADAFNEFLRDALPNRRL